MSRAPADREQNERLVRMASMIFEARGLHLRRAALARDAVRAQIDGLNRPMPAEVLTNPTLAHAACVHAVWAASRREELNLVLARHEAGWLAGLDEARRAFGRWRVLERLVSTPASAAARAEEEG